MSQGLALGWYGQPIQGMLLTSREAIFKELHKVTYNCDKVPGVRVGRLPYLIS